MSSFIKPGHWLLKKRERRADYCDETFDNDSQKPQRLPGPSYAPPTILPFPRNLGQNSEPSEEIGLKCANFASVFETVFKYNNVDLLLEKYNV